ncbi:MAG TPA: Mur ligase family protein [Candidatus Nanoarchaeia archaeon]|nr:Mur ligase family protein [Candidatus Nanoarchaeia archaeon]
MRINEFRERCISWEHPYWKNTDLITYWNKGGLSLEEIYENKELLFVKSYPIAILGSVGKTTLSRMLFILLQQHGILPYLTKINDNWLPQLPFAVKLALNDIKDISIFECGVACRGDTSLMASVVPAKTILYTEFAEVHLSELKSFYGVANEKLDFALYYPKARIISHIKNKEYIEKLNLEDIVYYGEYESEAHYRYNIKDMSFNDMTINIYDRDNTTEFKIKGIGFHLGLACCGAIAVYQEVFNRKFDVSYINIKEFVNPKQRMEVLEYKGVKIVIDTVNSNELSILNSLETIINLNLDIAKNAVIGEIYGLGNETERVMNNLVDKICNLKMDRFISIIFIGKYFSLHQDKLRKRIKSKLSFYNDQDEFKREFDITKYYGQLILLRSPTKRGGDFSNLIEGYNGGSEETRPEELICL